MKTSLKQKLTLLACSVIAALIILEIVLRIGGVILLKQKDRQNEIALNQKDSIVILSIGESTTFMGGEDSYPSQLEKMLNKRKLNKTFKIVNKGMPGIGTQYILEHINDWIQEYRPNMVVAMMGINDHNKLIPLDQETRLKKKNNILLNLQVFKLFQWIKASLNNKFSPESEMQPSDTNGQEKNTESKSKHEKMLVAALVLKNNKNYDDAKKLLKMLIALNDPALPIKRLHYELGEMLIEEENYKELKNVLYFLLKKNPSDPRASEWIEALCKKNKATTEITEATLAASEAKPNMPAHFELLSGCYALINNPEQSEKFLQKAYDIRSKNINSVTQTNFLKLADILYQNNIQPIFVQYPLRDVENLKILLESHDRFNTMTFVDNKPSFQNALKENDYYVLFTDRFAGNFGHCTKAGNAIIAENIAREIERLTK